MKSYIIVAALSVLTGGLSAQTSIEDVLRSVEANNKDLQANSQLVRSQKLEAKLDNNLPDPSVSYSHFWGNKEGMGFTGEFVASQSFDFPSVYVRKHKLTKAKSAGLDRQGMAFRQQILLQVKEVCLDLVLLNQQKNLLDTRLRNAEQLSAFYATRLEKGNANILETNQDRSGIIERSDRGPDERDFPYCQAAGASYPERRYRYRVYGYGLRLAG